MKDSFLKNILVNLRTAFSTNVRKRINDNTRRIVLLEDAIAGMDNQITEKFHYLNILDYYATHEEEASLFSKELEYLRRFGKYDHFPYQYETQLLEVVAGSDSEIKLPFVLHQGKKLFFPEDFSVNDAIWYYRNYIQRERLLGTGTKEEAPHQYQSPDVHVSEGDVVFDIGAAEGLFALDQIDKASRVVIVESDSKWIEPLRHTFAPYAEKVTIIQKLVSAVDTEGTVTLKTLLSDAKGPAFVKMDIEGYELPVITSAMDVLKDRKNIKIVAASYHRQHDADELKALFDQVDYDSEFSQGYMLFYSYDVPAPPYFRHGVIRAKSNLTIKD